MSKKESTFKNMLLALLIICLLSSLSLAFIHKITVKPIATVQEQIRKTAISEVVPKFDNLKVDTLMPSTGKYPIIINNAILNNKVIGYAVETYSEKGYGGLMKIMVGFDTLYNIYNIAIVKHSETPGLGDKIEKEKSDFALQFKGKNPATYKLMVKKDFGDVDAISAATISSRAFCDGVSRAYNCIIDKK